VQELEDYAKSIEFQNFSASSFLDYYESNGWKVGLNQMKDWKATVRYWKRNDSQRKPQHTKIEMPKYMQEMKQNGVHETQASKEQIEALQKMQQKIKEKRKP
jgi:hypothetical protein